MTVREEFGRLEGIRISYVGDGNNVAHSLALACALTARSSPSPIRKATPPTGLS